MLGKIRRILAIVPLEVRADSLPDNHTFRHISVWQPRLSVKVPYNVGLDWRAS